MDYGETYGREGVGVWLVAIAVAIGVICSGLIVNQPTKISCGEQLEAREGE